MGSLLSAALVFAAASLLTAFAMMRARGRRLEDLEALLEQVRHLGSLGYDLRLDEALEERLRTGLNRALPTLGQRHRVSERRGLEWERAVDSVEELIAVTDRRGHLMRANLAFARVLGRDVRDLIGEPLASFIHGADTDVDAPDPVALALGSQRPVMSFLGACRLGERMNLVASPIERSDGEHVVIAVIRPAPEARATDDLARIVEAMPLPALVAEPKDGRVVRANEPFIEKFGEVQNLDALAADDEELATLRGVAFSGQARREEVRLRRAGGRETRANVSGALRRHANGKPEAMLLVLGPGEHEGYTQVSVERDMLAEAMEAAGDGVLMVALDGRVMFANGPAAALYGLSNAALSGRALSELHISSLEGEGTAIDWAEVAKKGTWSGDLLRLLPDGHCLPTRVRIFRIRRPDIEAAVVVARDLSDERRMQEEVLRHQKLATLGEMSASITHEISNPLTFVLESARCLEEDLAEAKAEQALRTLAQDCVTGARRMQAILNEVRTFAYMGQSGARQTTFEAAISSALLLAGPAVRRVADIVQPPVEGPTVFADPGHLSQVVLNLVKNAAQAIESIGRRGTIRFEVSEGNGQGCLRVIDDGPGLAPGVQARLFHDFVTTKDRGNGTGFGLRLSAKLLAENGGRIEVESHAGATFSIFVPLNAVESDEPASPAAWDSALTMNDMHAVAPPRDTMPADVVVLSP